MSFRNKNDIRVYSELPFQINLIGQHREYVFPPCVDEPVMNHVDWADIEYANSRGDLFRSGLLIFNEDEQEEIYNELGIRDWKDKVWFDKDIVDTIENPTAEKIKKIIDIKNSLVFERIRGKVVYYVNSGKNISQKLIQVVNARYKELCAGITGSKIVVQSKDIDRPASADEVEDLKRQLAEMQRQMEVMASNNAAQADEKKPGGRKASNTRK